MGPEETARQRVVVISSTFPQYPGDPRGAFVLAHWEARAAAGDRVWLLAPRTRWTEPGVGRGVVVRRFAYAPRAWSTLTGRFGILENIRHGPWRAAWVAPLLTAARRALARTLDEVRPDLVVAHMWLPFGVLAAQAAAARGIEHEIFGHGTDVDLVLAAPGPVRRRLARALGTARRIYLPSHEKAARVRAALGHGLPIQVEAMVHCVPSPPATVARRSERRVLYLGRLIAQKGVDVLLEALARMADPPPLDVAGDGPQRGRLVRLARRRGLSVRFHGYVEGETKARLLARAAVVCVPSRPRPWGLGEGAPLVVREALAAGAHVVASRVGGIPELCAGDPRALLVPPGDPAVLSRAIERALSGLPAARASTVAADPM